MSSSNSGSRAVRLDTEHAIQHLMSSAVSRISKEIRVEFREQQIHLTGSTGSWHEKQLAQETLRAVSQAYVIHNAISVNGWNQSGR